MNNIMDNDENLIIDLDTLCEQLRIGYSTAYRLLRTGEIKAFRIGRNWKIPSSSIAEYINKQCKK